MRSVILGGEEFRIQGAVIAVDGNGDPLAGGAGGSSTAANQATQITAEQAIQASVGATADAPVGDNTTAESATARTGISLWKRIANLLIALVGTTGATTGAAVITDANGTIQQYLRGLVRLAITTGGWLVTSVDNGPAWTTVRGVAGERFTSADASGAVASVTDAPTTGQKLVLTDIEVSVDTAMRVDLKEETSGTIINSVYMAANSTINLCTRGKKKLATVNKKLQVITSVAGNISVNALYYSEA